MKDRTEGDLQDPLSSDGASESGRERLKVLILTRVFPNCADRLNGIYVFRQAKPLSLLCSVDVVAPVSLFEKAKRWAKRDGNIPISEEIEGLVIQHPVYFHIPRIFRQLSASFMFLSLYRYLKKRHTGERWDAIIGHCAYPDGLLCVMVGKRLRLPVFVTCHGTDVNVLSRIPSMRRLLKRALDQAVRVFTVSDSLKSRVADIGISPEKVIVINNGIDPKQFRIIDKAKARAHYGFPASEKILVFVGRLSREKGIDILIQALSILKDRNLLTVIAGGGPQGESLLELAYRSGLKDKVRFLGPLADSEIPRLMNAADLFVLPSRSEGYPVVLLESLACGIPALATRVGGVHEILCDEKLGIIVPPEDPIRLAEGIEAALDRTWDREYLANHVRHQTWEENARVTLQNISEALAAKDHRESMQAIC